MLGNKRGISLILLIITAIVMLIIVAAVMLELNDNNPVNEAYESTFKTNVRNMYEELNMYISDKSSETFGEFEPSRLSADFESVTYTGRGVEIAEENITEIITVLNQLPDYKDKISIVNGKLTLDTTQFSKEEVNWAREVLENT